MNLPGCAKYLKQWILNSRYPYKDKPKHNYYDEEEDVQKDPNKMTK